HPKATMVAAFFPLKKLRRHTRYLLFLAILLAGLAAVYHEMVASRAWTSENIRRVHHLFPSLQKALQACLVPAVSPCLNFKDTKKSQKSEVRSRQETSSEVFSSKEHFSLPSILQYKGQANLHVFEDWCGSSAADLRRYMHYPLYPHSRTSVQKLAVSPQWTNYGLRIFGYLHPYTDGEFVFALSSDDNSEFWLSTDDSPLHVQLLAFVGESGAEWTAPGEFNKYSSQTSRPVWLSSQRRYFFEVVHKQNDRGTDHVEVAWQLPYQDLRFTVIDSQHISLYVNESAALLTDVAHIPQTAASHQQKPAKQQSPRADVQRDDRRDSLYQVPLIDSSFLRGVLPDCVYKPSYTIKGFPLQRYQGLQFVHMSYIYPNDFTRLTHMESESSCFYPESPSYMKMFGFSRYMRLDRPESRGKDFGFHKKKLVLEGDYAHEDHQREKEMSPEQEDDAHLPDYGDDYDDYVQRRRRRLFSVVTDGPNSTLKETSSTSLGWQDRRKENESVTRNISQPPPEDPTTSLEPQCEGTEPQGPEGHGCRETSQGKRDRDERASTAGGGRRRPQSREWAAEEDKRELNGRENGKRARESVWGPGDGLEGTEEEDPTPPTPPPVFDPDVNWSQTFQVNHLDLQALRSDWIDLRCNISGNLLLEAPDAMSIVKAFVEKLNKKHQWQFTLLRVVNVVKRVDGVQGSRYLLELELRDARGQLLRLSHYVYALNRHSRHRSKDVGFRPAKPQQVLCNPVGFRWYPAATVHFIVPVKNQARWVQQLITDMEQLFRMTGDINFNLIITDYNSTDMDVRKALEKSSLPRYEYVNLSGNFERSAGLQAGIDLINDDHSIVFLCDLHIHFPPSIIDSIRKHCVEGYMAFAPVVLRLDCGATPSEAKGYWEVNGFGLLGIYKSDLDRVGGMNTQEFTDRWGGEDWELLDRILQAGLEVERIYLRNFFHHYHSKRGMWNRRMMPKH
uniref:Beta-1,4-N-acetylgalactosaminyltransferase n=1 Tax=Tetraodon nigroviridis TaxID=99883 RepID=H3DPG4_TETNG